MSYSRAHAVRANIRETNKRRITHLPVDSNLLLYHALIAVMSCDNSVCMRWGAGKGQSLTKDKKEARHDRDFQCTQRRDDFMLHADL